MDWRARITSDPEILTGRPVIKGTRISVQHILERLADAWTTEQIIQAYPHITHEDVLAALGFAADYMREERYIAIYKTFGRAT